MVGNMKFRYYFSLIFFTVFAFGLSAQAVLKPETLGSSGCSKPRSFEQNKRGRI